MSGQFVCMMGALAMILGAILGNLMLGTAGVGMVIGGAVSDGWV